MKRTDTSRGLRDKVIVITGGCGDIGSATTQKLATLGASVIVFDILDQATGRKRVRLLGGVDYARVDQGNAKQIKAAIARVTRRFDRLDVVIGNAALGSLGGLLDRTAADWEATLRVNVIGCAMLAQAAVRQMLRQPPDQHGVRGKLLFTSSWVGSHPFPGSPEYCVSKAGLDHLVRLVAQEYAAQGIRVNAVAPGILDAGLSRQAIARRPQLRRKMLASIPVGKLGTAEQVADAFVFLCSMESNYMTGHILFVDGGCSLTKHG